MKEPRKRPNTEREPKPRSLRRLTMQPTPIRLRFVAPARPEASGETAFIKRARKMSLRVTFQALDAARRRRNFSPGTVKKTKPLLKLLWSRTGGRKQRRMAAAVLGMATSLRKAVRG